MTNLAEVIGMRRACEVLQVARSTAYRWQEPPRAAVPAANPSPRALSVAEKDVVRETLNTPRFQDQAPREVFAALLDEGLYLCHWRTMYRILAENKEICERRNQLRHPVYTKPELLATAPCQVWSWDGRPFGRLVNVSSGTAHHQGCVSSPWQFTGSSNRGLVSFQGTRASRAGKTDSQ